MKKKSMISQIILTILLGALAIIVVLPFLLVLGISLSDEMDIAWNGYKLIPEHFTLDAYEFVLANPKQIIQAYITTIKFSVLGTFLSVLAMMLLAYPLSRKDMKGRKQLNFILFFTMLFNGGLVPTYILNTTYLHLNDTIWIYILPSLVNVWHVFMMRTFFAGLPEGLVEAARIDGAGQWRTLFAIVMPLSKPVLATVALLTFLGKWNCWYECMLYIRKQDLVSLQYYLQRILKNIQILEEAAKEGLSLGGAVKVPGETARMAMAVLVAGPALFVFPFFQKYFTKGLTVGSVKG